MLTKIQIEAINYLFKLPSELKVEITEETSWYVVNDNEIRFKTKDGKFLLTSQGYGFISIEEIEGSCCSYSIAAKELEQIIRGF